ncbi:MAG: c-type cytochrome biogenesis protein CcmI [Methylococcaceae bacterium]|nr:c-type cytochrome biogenesis protein CcmI [Methylococcaceae bacterium]
MTLFWLAVVGMLLGVAGFLFWPIVVAHEHYAKLGRRIEPLAAKKSKPMPVAAKVSVIETMSHKQRNIEIFKERLSELEAEKAQGNLDAAAFEQLKIELEKSLLNDVAIDSRPLVAAPLAVTAKHWFSGALMTLAVAVWSIGLYVSMGRSDDYTTRLAMQAQGTLKHLGEGQETQAMSSSTDPKAPDLNKAIPIIIEKLKQDPKNVAKWFLLANTYAATQQYAKAAETFLEIEKIVPKESPDYASVKGAYAQALYLANDEKITITVKAAIAETLALDSKEPNALVLKGVEAFEQEAYKQAIDFWEQAKGKANPQLIAQFIEPSIAAAQEKLGITPPSISNKSAINGTAKIQVTVDIAPELKSKVSADQVVFVFARPAGSKMPLAAERFTVKELPKTIILDDSKAAMPTAKLSSVASVDITARISLSGQAMPQEGDLFATQEQVAVSGAAPVKLLVNQIVGAATVSAPATAAATSSATLHLTVDITPELKAKVSPDQMVFIFAKPQGGKMPLAVERLTVKDLPANVVLDDSKAAMPTAALSSAEVVDVTARVSLSGGAIAQSGDLFASQEKVNVKQAKNPLKLIIDKVMP